MRARWPRASLSTRRLQHRLPHSRPSSTSTHRLQPPSRPFSTFSPSPPPPIYRPRRALLYVPGSSTRMLAKVATLSVDSVCLDLEDSVAEHVKEAARANVVATLAALASSHLLTSPSAHIPPSPPSPSSPRPPSLPPRPPAEVLVRINPVPSPHCAADLRALLDSPHLPHGIVIPKCESLSHLSHVLTTLSSHPSFSPLTPSPSSTSSSSPLRQPPIPPLALIALIETPLALLSLSSLTSHPSLQALILGGDDLASCLSLQRTPSSHELLLARQTLVLQGRAAGLQCIDVVKIDLEGEWGGKEEGGEGGGLRREAREGWEWGMSGKQVVHPAQVRVVEEEMVGGVERLRWSARVVRSWEEMEAKGVGAWRLEGKMIDRPTVRIAQRMLHHAQACGVDVHQLQAVQQ